uniref:Uncharacterized protein n=1 Tax=Heterorhabditis bacteriophora TaxID=37862 RepID=A0A1I7WJQ5_HETBA
MSIGQSVRQDASQAAPTRRRMERRASETFRLKNKSVDFAFEFQCSSVCQRQHLIPS